MLICGIRRLEGKMDNKKPVEREYYSTIKKILLNDERILNVLQDKKLKNGYRPDFIVFLKNPLRLTKNDEYFDKLSSKVKESFFINKCFGIEVKPYNQLNLLSHGIKQIYDKYKDMYYKGYKLEHIFFMIVPFKSINNYSFEHIEWVLQRMCWAFGIGFTENKIYENYPCFFKFTLNEQKKFRIYFDFDEIPSKLH